MKKKPHNKVILWFILISILIILTSIIVIFCFPEVQTVFKTVYEAKDFGIEVIYSDRDENQNGIDDYTDILLGAKEDAKNRPTYKNAYYAGGYPPEGEGVCTDVIWRAFKHAGYTLKDMVDADIKEHIEAYPRTEGNADPNIDFRRVDNLRVFFSRNAKNLTTDLTKIEQWQPGDIVTFGKSHIGIISDKRNEKGIPYLIHNASQLNREEDALERWNTYDPISGHFRW